MIIAIDFDGTIVEQAYPEIGQLRPHAREVINKLYHDGHYIIIWTCRYIKKDVENMLDFLNKHWVAFDNVNENSPKLPFQPHPKIYADIYIDDHSLIPLPDWKDIYEIVKNYSK